MFETFNVFKQKILKVSLVQPREKHLTRVRASSRANQRNPNENKKYALAASGFRL